MYYPPEHAPTQLTQDTDEHGSVFCLKRAKSVQVQSGPERAKPAPQEAHESTYEFSYLRWNK